jgi:hypothetical protein
MANRMAIFFCRAVARAIIRFAALEHAISSTSLTMAISAHNGLAN